MTVHANSVSAYHSLNISDRAQAVLKVYVEATYPMADREVMRRMGFTEPNQVRPRCTELIEAGLLEECGDTIDKETQKRVRLCRPAGRALAIKPVDPAKELRRLLCAQIAKLGDQGCTSADLARTFPSLKPADINLALGVCWAFGAIERRQFVKRENLPVHFITESGRALLAKTEAQCP
jgi:hypothetical protein